MTNDIVPAHELLPEVPNNLPGWGLERYDGDEIDFSTWMIGLHFWKDHFDELEDLMEDNDKLNVALATSRFKALGRTLSLSSTVDRAKVRQLLDAAREGWGQYLPSPCTTTADLLRNLLDDYDENGSEYKDLVFIVDTLLPSLENVGISPDKVLSIPTRWSKTRAVCPALNNAIEEYKVDADTDKLTDSVNYLLGLVADDSIAVRDVREKVRQKGVTAEIPEATVYLDGDDYLVVMRISHTKKKSLLRAVRSALGKIVLNWNEDVQITELFKILKGKR